MEEYIKNKIDEYLSDIEKKMNANGVELTEKDKNIFKTGCEYGIMIAGLALVENRLNLNE